MQEGNRRQVWKNIRQRKFKQVSGKAAKPGLQQYASSTPDKFGSPELKVFQEVAQVVLRL